MRVIQPVFTCTHNAATTGIVTTSWSVLHSGILGPIQEIEIFNNTSQALDFGVGNSAGEVQQRFTIFPNGNPSVPITLPHDARLALRGTVTSATAGLVIFNFYR